MKDRKQNLVDRYVRGEMDDEERASFEQNLSEDEELREMYRFTVKVCEAVKDRNEKLDKISQWKSDKKQSCSHKTVTRGIVCALISAAAVAALFFTFNHQPVMPELDVHKYECYRGTNNVMNVADMIKNGQYDKALSIIEKAEYTSLSAIDSVKSLIPEVSSDDLSRIDYEISALSLDYNEMRWLKVYVFIGLERYDEAIELLNEIRDENSMYSVKADSVLNAM